MKKDQRKIGEEGEAMAVEYLKKKSYKILHRNWYWQHKELDIICQKDDFIVVVEVKSRSTRSFEHPKDAITLGKIKNIVVATNAYMEEKEIDLEVRFDVIAILRSDNGVDIEHIENAFIAPIV